MEIDNDCPTLDNHINCSECTHECKLRMQPKNSKEVEVPPEPLLNTISVSYTHLTLPTKLEV